jgi:hypothetical protein
LKGQKRKFEKKKSKINVLKKNIKRKEDILRVKSI